MVQLRTLLAKDVKQHPAPASSNRSGSHKRSGSMTKRERDPRHGQEVRSAHQTMLLLQESMRGRQTFGTKMNVSSSRSHCIVTIRVSAENRLTGDVYLGKLHLVDLAGSENVGRSEVSGQRLREAQNINRSLSALADVFLALSKKQAHVPYRNTKLTHFLADSLGGDSNTLMYISPPCLLFFL